MIAFQRRSDLTADAFDQGDFVVRKSIALLAPNEPEQAKRMSRDAYRGNQS